MNSPTRLQATKPSSKRRNVKCRGSVEAIFSQPDSIETPLGWLGWQWRWVAEANEWRLCRTSLGHATSAAAAKSILDEHTAAPALADGDQELEQLSAELACDLAAWASGADVDLMRVPIVIGDATPFRWSVTRACRQIGSGNVVTYGELARRVGRPGAARAVGRVMATNPLPIIVPCHRVVASGGAMRGFSAIGGIATKERMLALEGFSSTSSVTA